MNYYICEIILTWLTLIILAVLVQENNRIPQKEKKSYFLTYGVIALAALSEWLGLQFNGDPSVPLWTVKLIKCADYILTPMAGGALVAQIHHKSIFKKLIEQPPNSRSICAAIWTPSNRQQRFRLKRSWNIPSSIWSWNSCVSNP